MSACPVVVIRTANGPVRINASEFDAEKHVLWTDRPVLGDIADLGLDAVRAEAEALGIKVDMRWGEPRLRQEIEKAKG